MGGGGSREEEARNPPPGNNSARLRNEALLSLGDRGRRSAAPARPGEARGESGGRRPAPRPPAAAESPGPAGAGRGGAWERLAGGGGLGARRRAAPDRRPARTGSRWACGARCPGAGQPRTDPLAPLPPEGSPWELTLEPSLSTQIPLGLARRKGTAFCSGLPRRSVFVFEVSRNGRRRCSQLKSEDIIRTFCRSFRKTFLPWHNICFTSPAPPLSLVWNSSLFAVWRHFPPNVDSKGLVPSL